MASTNLGYEGSPTTSSSDVSVFARKFELNEKLEALLKKYKEEFETEFQAISHDREAEKKLILEFFTNEEMNDIAGIMSFLKENNKDIFVSVFMDSLIMSCYTTHFLNKHEHEITETVTDKPIIRTSKIYMVMQTWLSSIMKLKESTLI
jgi:hypothetical protein